MRNIPRVSFLAVATVLLLAGCTPTIGIVKPEPAPSSTPIFASEEDALAAATAAYAAYVKVSDQILMDGGTDPDRIKPYATKEALEAALDGYRTFREKGYRSIGSSEIFGDKLQRFNPDAEGGIDLVDLYSCLDVSHVDVVDGSGNSAVSADRPDLQAFQLTFDFDFKLNKLVLSSRDAWSSSEICAK